MARNRMIKPAFWNDEKLATKISRDARLVYIALWNFSDDFGVVKGNSRWLKNQIFPYDDNLKITTFKKWLNELVKISRIRPFCFSDEQYFFITKFQEHQVINRPSKQNRNPSPPPEILENGWCPKHDHASISDDSLNDHGVITDENKIKENKRKEKKRTLHEWPKDFSLDENMKKYAIQNGIDKKKLDLFFADFKNWSESKGAKYKDWSAAFRNRVLKAQEFGKQFLVAENGSVSENGSVLEFKPDPLVNGFQYLIKNGPEKFSAYCEKNKLDQEQIERILNKYGGKMNTGGILKDIGKPI